VVDGALFLHLPLAAGLALKLVIERENRTLRVWVDVACSSSSRAELGAGLRDLAAEERRWASCSGWAGGCWGFEGVACSSTARVDVLAR
jgi:hypothetical protein